MESLSSIGIYIRLIEQEYGCNLSYYKMASLINEEFNIDITPNDIEEYRNAQLYFERQEMEKYYDREEYENNY